MGRGELRTLQAGRGLAALTVVLYHLNGSIFGQAKYWPEQISPLLRGGDSGVQFFFVLSGFIMAWVHADQIGGRGNAAPFLWKRFLRVYPAYWAVLALVLVGGATGSLWVALTLWPVDTELPLAVSWTLQHEVLFYAVFAVLLWRPWLGAALMIGWLLPSLTAPFLHGKLPLIFSPQHLLFAFGMGVAWLLRRVRVRFPGIVASVGLGWFAATWLVACYGTVNDAVLLRWSYGLGAALSVLGFVELERSHGLRVHPMLVALGDASYAIYLIHFPVLSIGAKVFMRVGADRAPEGVCFAALLAAALAAGVGFRALVEKPLLSAFSRRLALGRRAEQPSG